MTAVHPGDIEDSRLKPLGESVIGEEHRRMLLALAQEPMTPSALADACSCSVAEAQRFLNELLAHRMARWTEPPEGGVALTDRITVEYKCDGRVHIRASNEQGEFIEVRFRP